MKLIEMHKKVREVYEANEDRYYYIGIRFEDKEREVGEECEWSKHNPDREDEREFPAYGTEEYDELPELDGTSAWDLSLLSDDELPGYGRIAKGDEDRIAERMFGTYHCYVIAGNRLGQHDNPDPGEILIKDAVVIAKIF